MTVPPRLTLSSIRRARLFRVVLLYASASFIVLQVCDIFVSHLGLPGWVFPSALLLLVIGLPLVLATAVAYSMHGAERSEGARSAADGHGAEAHDAAGGEAAAGRTAADVPGSADVRDAGGARRLIPLRSVLGSLTWRRTLLTGAASFALLLLFVGAYAGSRAVGVGPFATLMGAGLLAHDEVLVLAEFEARTPDRDMGRTVTEAVRADLLQSRSVALLEGERIRDALRRMARAPDEPLDLALARELAVREGLKAVISGEVAAAGSGYILVARVVSAADGSTLVALRETADSDATLIPAIDRLSRALRERIGEPLRSLAARPPLAQTTTSSLEALQLYARGVRLHRIDPARGLPLLREAVALDSGFVAAWFHLALALEETGAPQSMTREALVRAAAHLHRLHARERYLFQGVYHWLVEGDQDARLRAHQAMLDLYPDDPDARVSLSATLLDAGDARRAAEIVEPLLAHAQPGLGALVMAARTLIHQNRPDSALAVLDHRAGLLQEHPMILRIRVSAAGAMRDYDAVEREARRLMAATPAPSSRIVALGALAAAAAQRGQEDALERHRSAQVAVVQQLESLAPGSQPSYMLFWWAAREAVREGNRDGLRALLTQMPVPEPADSTAALDVPFATLSQAHAMAGDLVTARALLERARQWWPRGYLRTQAAEVRIAEALIALEENRIDEAEAGMLDARSADCPGCLLPLVARAREANGERERALELWDIYDGQGRTLNSLFSDALWIPELYEARARLKLHLGDSSGAAREFRLALAAFAAADPVHASRVAAWRRELRRLE